MVGTKLPSLSPCLCSNFSAAAAKSLSVVSDSVRPHRWQPTRLSHPWDSPGENTGVGCHFLLQCMEVKSESEVTQSCPTLIDPVDCSLPGSSVHGIFQARVLEWGPTGVFKESLHIIVGFPQISVGKESTCNAGDPSSIPGLGRSPGEGIGYPLQYSWASLVAQLVKNPPTCGRPGFDP